jgi:hypothetical protein
LSWSIVGDETKDTGDGIPKEGTSGEVASCLAILVVESSKDRAQRMGKGERQKDQSLPGLRPSECALHKQRQDAVE